MTDYTNRDQAFLLAENHRIDQGYEYGSCLNIKQMFSNDETKWEVEYAHRGLTERSLTADPPSLRFGVDLSTKEVQLIDLM